VVRYAAARLSQSVAERVSSEAGEKKRWLVVFDADQRLVTRDRTAGASAHVLIAVCHAAESFRSAQEIRDCFDPQMAGHSLRDACMAICRCAQWWVLSGDNVLQAWETPTNPGAHVEDDAAKLWRRFNLDKLWRVIHVLRLGVPIRLQEN
jgi:hypothetical protein